MTDKVKEEILAVRATGLTNMFDINTVKRIAYEMDFHELTVFLGENRHRQDSAQDTKRYKDNIT